MTITDWKNKNDVLFNNAVVELAKIAIEEFGTLEEYDGDKFDYKAEIERYVEENWDAVLDNELVNAINERYDVACIINANQYGGGGYEVIRYLAIATAKYAIK